jgi:hypothetical protein
MLCRWTSQHTVLIGSSYANRRPDTKDLIGYFLNVLPMVVAVDKELTFSDLVAQVRGQDAVAGAPVGYGHGFAGIAYKQRSCVCCFTTDPAGIH